MIDVALFNEPLPGFGYFPSGDSLYYSLPRHMPEASRLYWLTCNSMSLYSNTMVTWASSFLSDRDSALRHIRAMESFENNWDGFGGVSIPKVTSSTAANFVSSLPTHVPAPEISANSNGTISLEWENEVGRAHLEIGVTKYSLYFRRYGGDLIFRDGLVKEIDRTREGLQNEMFCLAPPQDYTINNIRLAEAA